MKKICVFLFMTTVVTSLSLAQQPEESSDYQTKSFTVQQGGLLDVDVEPGAVHIESWAKNEVLVEAEGIDERHPGRFTASQSGNTVTVRYRDSRNHTDRLVFTIKVPVKFNAELKTSGGSIKQKDVLAGDFHAETQGGSIKLDHINGKVNVETGGGSIKIGKIEGDALLKTGGGSIETGTISGIVDVSTGGGSITLREPCGKVKASTGGGSIKVEHAKSWVDLSTGGGSVHVSEAQYGAKIKTGGGSIEMEEITGVVNLSTGGGSIRCELTPGDKGNSTIRTGGGEILLSLPVDTKAVVDATIHQGSGWGRHKKRCKILSEFKADKYEGDEKSDEIHAVYTLNGGGPVIQLETSDSNIEISKMASK